MSKKKVVTLLPVLKHGFGEPDWLLAGVDFPLEFLPKFAGGCPLGKIWIVGALHQGVCLTQSLEDLIFHLLLRLRELVNRPSYDFGLWAVPLGREPLELALLLLAEVELLANHPHRNHP